MSQHNAGTWEKICYIFDKKQKMKATVLFVIIVIGAFVELLGVSENNRIKFRQQRRNLKLSRGTDLFPPELHRRKR